MKLVFTTQVLEWALLPNSLPLVAYWDALAGHVICTVYALHANPCGLAASASSGITLPPVGASLPPCLALSCRLHGRNRRGCHVTHMDPSERQMAPRDPGCINAILIKLTFLATWALGS